MGSIIKPLLNLLLLLFLINLSTNSQVKQENDTILANKHFEKAISYYQNNNYDTATIYFNYASRIYERCEQWSKYLQSETKRGECYQRNWKFTQAKKIIKPAIKKVLSFSSENDTVVTSSYSILGLQYYYLSDYDSALLYWNKSLRIDRNLLGETHIRVAGHYLNIGVVYQDKLEYKKALEYYDSSQKIYKELFGEKDKRVADTYNNIGLIHLYNYENDKALENFMKCIEIYKEKLGDNHQALAKPYNNTGRVYANIYQYDKALGYFMKSLEIQKEHLGEKHQDVAYTYYNIGSVYRKMIEYNKAIEYIVKSLEITKELFGENHAYVAYYYNELGMIYNNKSEYNKALENFQNSLEIRKAVFGDEHAHVAQCYNNIGIVYWAKSEFDRALEFYYKGLEIVKEQYTEKHLEVTNYYNNIGLVYNNKSQYDKALEYHLKCLELIKELLGEKHQKTSDSYNNIGNVYSSSGEYDKALEYYSKSLDVRKQIFDENHLRMLGSYNNIGGVYRMKSEFDKALEYYFYSLDIANEYLGNKHSLTAYTHIVTGLAYEGKAEYIQALEHYQLGIASGMKNFNDTGDIRSIPHINDYLSWDKVLWAMELKADIFADTSKRLPAISDYDRFGIALRHYKACDTLLSQVRVNMKTKSDKIELGKKSNYIYKKAVELCIKMAKDSSYIQNSQELKESAFYFSEKNKSSVLLESLAGVEAKQIAGIPDSVLEKEHQLQIDIAFYKKILAEETDSTINERFKAYLFNASRSYDSLITNFENSYPDYYELKYNQTPATVEQLANLLDNNTAIISYVTGDSTIAIMLINNRNLYVTTVVKPRDFEESIQELRYNISNPSVLINERISDSNESIYKYQDAASKLYNTLFPANVQDVISSNTENLIIIPDGKLVTLPFEVLHTKKYDAKWMGWEDRAYFSEMPYLLKDYNISYNYSSNLHYKTFFKSEVQKGSEYRIENLDDWLALAPVFDNESIAGTTLISRQLFNQITSTGTDEIRSRAFTPDGKYISALPSSLDETEAIFNLFDNQRKTALLKTHLQANEEFVKSGELAKFRYLHFATHGIMNEEKPELSGLILAQDKTSHEDNILFTGEIYNLKFNADLTVLSACETGLGKISEGEGVIGLSRALIYAGTKNLMVSLWKVSDQSTSKLMIEFYTNLLKDKKGNSNSKHLRNAKLKLINESEYFHPFLWSPFILIGE